MIALLLLACSLPFGGGASQSSAPTAPAAPADGTAAATTTTTAAVVTPGAAVDPAAARQAAGTVTPTMAPPPGGLAPARIYATLVSHNEEVPNPLCTPVVTDQNAYLQNRAQVIDMAKAVVAHKAAWDMQNEWQFLQAVKSWDTPELKAQTDNKNLIDWIAHYDPSRIQVDAHTHGKSHSYADVVKLLEDLGAPRNGVVGGFIYYPTPSQIWTPLRNDVKGKKYPTASWKPEILWGAATSQHQGPDMRASGIWRPKSAEEFTTDDPQQKLVFVGGYQYSPYHDFTGVKELVDRLHAGELQPGHMYTASVFFHQCSLTASDISAMMAEIDALAPEVAAGNLVWMTLSPTVETWRTTYQSVATKLDPLHDAPMRTGGGMGGPRGGKPGGGAPGGRPRGGGPPVRP